MAWGWQRAWRLWQRRNHRRLLQSLNRMLDVALNQQRVGRFAPRNALVALQNDRRGAVRVLEFSSIAGYDKNSGRVPLPPLFLAYPILLLLAAVIPSASYRGMGRQSIVERLRENE